MSVAEYNLGRHCGITFARIKPASLFTVREEDMKILAYFAAKFRAKGFVFVCMRHMNGRVLFYVYHIGALEKALSLKQKIFRREGISLRVGGAIGQTFERTDAGWYFSA